MKQLLFIFLISCTFSDVRDLYEKDSAEYNALKDAAAKECVSNNEVFTNLKASDFRTYSLLTSGNYIKLANNYYIRIDSVDADNVQFTVISDESDSFKNYLFQAAYSVTRTQNNAVVDMIATGVCEGTFYKGTPGASTSQLAFTASNYNIEDGVTSTTTNAEPTIYKRRLDSFTMQTTVPAFLFLWGGIYQSFEKNDGESEQSATFANAELSLDASNRSACIEDHDATQCDTVLGTINALSINSTAYSNTRESNSDNALKRYYYTNFP